MGRLQVHRHDDLVAARAIACNAADPTLQRTEAIHLDKQHFVSLDNTPQILMSVIQSLASRESAL